MEHEGLTATQDAHQEKKRKRDDSGNEKGHESCGPDHSLALSQTRALKLERSIVCCVKELPPCPSIIIVNLLFMSVWIC